MAEPSGDQEGSATTTPPPLVRRRASPPTGMTQSSPRAAKATCLPSGDSTARCTPFTGCGAAVSKS